MKEGFAFDSALIFLLLILISFVCLPCFAGGKADAKAGKKVFQDMQCAICHLDGGNNLNPERPLKGAGFQKRYPANADKALAKLIREGTKGGMPPFAKDKLSEKNLADVIAYVRSLSTPETGKKSK